MGERRYTLSELDKMRNAIAAQYESHPVLCSFNGVITNQESVDAFWRKVEDRLRTVLIAGIDPAEFSKPDLNACKETSYAC